MQRNAAHPPKNRRVDRPFRNIAASENCGKHHVQFQYPARLTLCKGIVLYLMVMPLLSHLVVVSFMPDRVNQTGSIQIIGTITHFETIHLHHFAGVGKHKVAIRFEVNHPPPGSWNGSTNKVGCRKTLVVFHLRIGKSKPDFVHLASAKQWWIISISVRRNATFFSPFWAEILAPVAYGHLLYRSNKVLSGKSCARPTCIHLFHNPVKYNRLIILKKAFTPFSFNSKFTTFAQHMRFEIRAKIAPYQQISKVYSYPLLFYRFNFYSYVVYTQKHQSRIPCPI